MPKQPRLAHAIPVAIDLETRKKALQESGITAQTSLEHSRRFFDGAPIANTSLASNGIPEPDTADA